MSPAHTTPCDGCDFYADGIGGGCIAGRTVPPPAGCDEFTPVGTFDPFKHDRQEGDPREPKEVAQQERG